MCISLKPGNPVCKSVNCVRLPMCSPAHRAFPTFVLSMKLASHSYRDSNWNLSLIVKYDCLTNARGGRICKSNFQVIRRTIALYAGEFSSSNSLRLWLSTIEAFALAEAFSGGVVVMSFDEGKSQVWRIYGRPGYLTFCVDVAGSCFPIASSDTNEGNVTRRVTPDSLG